MISHPLGKAWHEQFKAGSPEEIPLPLPDEAALQHLCRDLPLRVRQLVEEQDLYMALLQVSCLTLPCMSHLLYSSLNVGGLSVAYISVLLQAQPVLAIQQRTFSLHEARL